MFDTTKTDLKNLLEAIDKGSTQLPDFQRDYVWSDEDVQSLIASIVKGFPVGALLMLETGGEVNFKPRLLEGVPARDCSPKELILDGQQRMTSLYQSMFSKNPAQVFNSRSARRKYYYYIQIQTALEAIENNQRLEDAIIAVPEDKIIRENFDRDIKLDLSTDEAEYEANCFPLNKSFDFTNWLFAWLNYWSKKNDSVDMLPLADAFRVNVLEKVSRYEMPIIKLDRTNTREAICLVFEKVNVGGKKLDAFELLTAIYAADSFDLREDWNGDSKKNVIGRRREIIGDPPRSVLNNIASTDFLQASTLLHTRNVRLNKAKTGAKGKDLPQISCSRASLLELPRSAYQASSDSLKTGFIEAAKFLNNLKIIWEKDIPYPAQTIALASVYAILDQHAKTTEATKKLEKWFWAVVFGELYSSSVDSRLARDVPALVAWITGGESPYTLEEAIFRKDRLVSLRSRRASAYKGVHALLMSHGCKDFIKGTPVDIMTFFNEDIDIHHIFPQAWCKAQGIPAERYDSIINKTPLSKRTNIIVGGNAPSVYLSKIEKEGQASPEALNGILQTHLINPDLLRADDFDAFYAARHTALANLIATAMGKKVFEDVTPGEPEEFMEEEI